jgi:hypothetical protein
MFKNIKRSLNALTTYYATFQSWEFILEGMYHSHKIKIAVTLHQNGYYTINLYNEMHQRKEYYRVRKETDIVQELMKSKVVLEIIQEIQEFETIMKHKIETTDEKILYHEENGKITISFRIISPLLKSKRFSLEKKEEIKYEKKLKEEVFSLQFSKENGKVRFLEQKLINNALDERMFTHRSFLEDVADIIVKKPHIRIKLLLL